MSARKSADGLVNLEKALVRLEEAVAVDRSRDFIKEATVQCFENAFELFWKSLKRIMEQEGVTAPIASPKKVIQLAFQHGYIDEERHWLDMLSLRNRTTHVYFEEEPANEIDEAIIHLTPHLRRALDSLRENYSDD